MSVQVLSRVHLYYITILTTSKDSTLFPLSLVLDLLLICVKFIKTQLKGYTNLQYAVSVFTLQNIL